MLFSGNNELGTGNVVSAGDSIDKCFRLNEAKMNVPTVGSAQSDIPLSTAGYVASEVESNYFLMSTHAMYLSSMCSTKTQRTGIVGK